MTTGINAMIRRNVSPSRKAASCTTKTSHSQSPKAAGLSMVHFFQSAFHMVSAWLRPNAILRYHGQAHIEVAVAAQASDPDACQSGDLPDVSDRSACAGRLCQKVESIITIVADRCEGLVHIAVRVWSVSDDRLPNQKPSDGAGQDHVLHKSLPSEARPEQPGVLARPARPALGGMLETQDSALKRMHLFE